VVLYSDVSLLTWPLLRLENGTVECRVEDSGVRVERNYGFF
jgi:hypothetical protein